MSDDLYVRKLEHDAEETDKLLSKLAELVDDGIYCSTLREVKMVLAQMGELLGLHMEDVYDELEDDEPDSTWGEEWGG